MVLLGLVVMAGYLVYRRKQDAVRARTQLQLTEDAAPNVSTTSDMMWSSSATSVPLIPAVIDGVADDDTPVVEEYAV